MPFTYKGKTYQDSEYDGMPPDAKAALLRTQAEMRGEIKRKPGGDEWFDQRMAEGQALGLDTSNWMGLDPSVIQGQINQAKMRLNTPGAMAPGVLPETLRQEQAAYVPPAPPGPPSGGAGNPPPADPFAFGGPLTKEAYDMFLQREAPQAGLTRALQNMGLPTSGIFGNFLMGLFAPLMSQFVGKFGATGQDPGLVQSFQQGLQGGFGTPAQGLRNPSADFGKYLESDPQQAARLALYARPGVPAFMQEYLDRSYIPQMVNQYAAGPAMQGTTFLDYLRADPAFARVFQ